MDVTVSEDLNSPPRGKLRFCATVDGDADPNRGGFGSSERAALCRECGHGDNDD